jgi:hypothetical protein
MKKLLVLLLCNCLLVPLASGQQGYVQQRGERPGDKFGQMSEQLRAKRGGDDPRQTPNKFGSQDEAQSSVSRRDATNKARDAYPGKVVGIRRDGDQWSVRMDNGGNVFNVLVDAESGAVRRP